MEYAQLESRLEFLDKQQRRDKEEIASLRHQLALSQSEKGELIKRLDGLESELTNLKSELGKIDMLENRTERFKEEIKNIVAQQGARQRQSIKDLERSRAIEMDSQVKAINEVRRELQRSRDLDELITLARTETDRQGGVITSLRQKVEEFTHDAEEKYHTIAFLEEQRRSDIQRLNEVQAQTAELYKKATLQISKTQLLEQQIPQFGKFQTALDDMRGQLQNKLEQTQYQFAQTERKLKTWDELSETVQNRVNSYESRLERYAEHHQRNIKALEELQAFRERLQRDQHEFTELQRLNSDRLRNEVEAWQANQEHSLHKNLTEMSQRLDEMVKNTTILNSQLADIGKEIAPFEGQITMLLKIMEEDALARAIAGRDWQQRFEQLATEEGL